MSRIGRKIIKLPSGVKLSVEPGQVKVEGPKGKLSVPLPAGISIDQADSTVTVKRAGDAKDLRAKHGLTRALLANAVQGVGEGWTKKLDVVGIGYRAEVRGRYVNFSLGHSHPVEFPIPEGLQIAVEREQRQISNYVATIKVYVNGVETSEWTYNSGNNAVKFNAGHVPDEGAVMKVTYYEP